MPVQVKLNGKVLYVAPDQTAAIVFAFDNNLTERRNLKPLNRRMYNQPSKTCVQYVQGLEFVETLNEEPN